MSDNQRKRGIEVKAVIGAMLPDQRHPEATFMKVEDGHLVVLDERDLAIAIYAPGKWLHAAFID